MPENVSTVVIKKKKNRLFEFHHMKKKTYIFTIKRRNAPSCVITPRSMKTIRQAIGFWGVTACLFSACKNESPNRTLLESIVVSPASATLVPGDTVRLTAHPVPADAEDVRFTWSAVHTDIASVTDDGTVTAVNNGATSVKVKSGDREASAKISVIPLTITVTPAQLKLMVGNSAVLQAVSSPPNSGLAEKPFVWTTDNAGVATVTGGQVRGISAGSAEITVSGRVNGDIRTTVPVTVEAATYQNPVTNGSLPDPTVIKASDGLFYLYATEDTRNVPIMRSQDLVHWNFAGTCFNDAGRPAWAETGAGIWAPDINYINGQYVLFYSMSVWGGEWTCGIGIATSDSPSGPFADRGKLFLSNEIGVQNSIDPFYMEDGGKKYLIWGSFRGIYGIELQDDGLALKPDATPVQIAGTAFEASYIYRRGSYYYLFCSWGSCCNGASSNYKTVVGRSTNLFGPYLAKNGNSMLTNAYENVVQGNATFAGTGHNAEIVTDDAGNDWILYHAYVKATPNGRRLMLDKIIWTADGWPSVSGNAPSSEAEIPVFN
jgi:arabinan endo-1,5-alpha-L-arabinosidase